MNRILPGTRDLTEFGPGVEFNQPFEVYHSVDAIHAGFLEDFLISPAHGVLAVDTPLTMSTNILRGLLTHCRVFEPELYEYRYAFLPPGIKNDKRLKAYKEFAAANDGREIINNADRAAVEGMYTAISYHAAVGPLLLGKSGKSEVSVYAIDDETGLPLKARLDRWLIEDCLIADLKCISFLAKDRTLQSMLLDRGYARKMAFYQHVCELAGYTVEDACLVYVEQSPPHGIKWGRIADVVLKEAMKEVRQTLKDVAKCVEENYWPNYSPEMRELMLPDWKMRELANS